METERQREVVNDREKERKRESERDWKEDGKERGGVGRLYYHARRRALRSRAAQWLKRSTEERAGITTPPHYSTCRSKMRERYKAD